MITDIDKIGKIELNETKHPLCQQRHFLTDLIPRAQSAPKTHKKIVEVMKRYAKPSDLVLDCPCGEGALYLLLSEAGINVLAGDLYPEYFKLPAPAKCERVDLNKENAPWPDAFFNQIICCDGVGDLENVDAAFREFSRMIRAEGHFICSFPNTANFSSRIRYFCSGFFNKFKQPILANDRTSTVRPLFFWQVSRSLERAGFEIDSILFNRVKSREYVFLPLFIPIAVFALILSIKMIAKELRHSTFSPRRWKTFALNQSLMFLLSESIIVVAKRK